jgi:hypothetical protein
MSQVRVLVGELDKLMVFGRFIVKPRSGQSHVATFRLHVGFPFFLGVGVVVSKPLAAKNR